MAQEIQLAVAVHVSDHAVEERSRRLGHACRWPGVECAVAIAEAGHDAARGYGSQVVHLAVIIEIAGSERRRDAKRLSRREAARSVQKNGSRSGWKIGADNVGPSIAVEVC